jgi:predicted metal-binding protein
MMAKQEVLIVGCKNMMLGTCPGCSRCIDALNNRTGQFSTAANPQLTNPELIGLLDCGGCPGNGMNSRLNDFKLWNQPPNGALPDYIAVGNCISAKNAAGNYLCPYASNIIEVIENKASNPGPGGAAVSVIRGTHAKGNKPIKP